MSRPGAEIQPRTDPAGRRPLRRRGPATLGALLLALPAAAGATPAWWDQRWPYRARIECQAGAGDVAWVRVPLAGRTTRDGRDLRLVDADGSLRNFEIIHHAPQLETLIRFKAVPDRPLTTWLYYGNPAAGRINTSNPGRDAWQRAWNAWSASEARRQRAGEKRRGLQQRLQQLRRELDRARRSGHDSSRLEQQLARCQRELAGLGSPSGAARPPEKPRAWQPRRGVLLRVYRKPKDEHPLTLGGLRRLMRAGELEGACFCAGVADGFNRFGPSDDYISVYDGYLRIERPGSYAFCTVSDDGSWLRINGRTVLSWPGAHGWQGAEHGQHNVELKLARGVAHVEYYHEEGSGGQMAFLGWKPPGAEKFWSIPARNWLDVRPARVTLFEARRKPLLAVPVLRVLNTYWVRDSEGQQATLVEFRSRSPSRPGKIVATHWSFGDGLEADGARVRHVYFRTGRPQVTLTVSDARGARDSVTCAPRIFYVDVRARYFRYGNARQYAAAAAGYDVQRMALPDLQLYAEFWRHLENWPEHLRAVNAFLQRCPDSPLVPRFAASAARACTQPGAYDPQRAAQLYELALRGTRGLGQRLELKLQRARLLAWDLGRYQPARRLLADLLHTLELKSGPAGQRLRRRATILLGDSALLAGDYAAAEKLYRQAQRLGRRRPAQAEMLAKTGSYGYTVEDLLARGQFDWACRTLDRWESEFPLQKLEGYTFFLRGKVLYVQHPGPLALRYLELAERVAPRAVHVPQAVWLRANCLLAMQRYDQALAQFLRIRRDFTHSEFFEQAPDKIRLCQTRRAQTPPPANRE